MKKLALILSMSMSFGVMAQKLKIKNSTLNQKVNNTFNQTITNNTQNNVTINVTAPKKKYFSNFCKVTCKNVDIKQEITKHRFLMYDLKGNRYCPRDNSFVLTSMQEPTVGQVIQLSAESDIPDGLGGSKFGRPYLDNPKCEIDSELKPYVYSQDMILTIIKGLTGRYKSCTIKRYFKNYREGTIHDVDQITFRDSPFTWKRDKDLFSYTDGVEFVTPMVLTGFNVNFEAEQKMQEKYEEYVQEGECQAKEF